MASITIRNLDEKLKGRLRARAASLGRSMEEEVRNILRAALEEPRTPTSNLAERIRRRFGSLGDVDLPIAPREPVREPTFPGAAPRTRDAGSAKGHATKPRHHE